MKKTEEKNTPFRFDMQWPLWLSLVWVPMLIVLFVLGRKAFVAGLVFFAIYEGAVWGIYLSRRKKIAGELVRFASNYSQVQKGILHDMEIPYGICDEKGEWLWYNETMGALLAETKEEQTAVPALFPEENLRMPVKGELLKHVRYNKKSFRLNIKRVQLENMKEASQDASMAVDFSMPLFAVYMYDETEILYLKKEWRDNQLVVGLIYMDNVDEAKEALEDVRKSMLVALVEKRINNYFSKYHGILKRMDDDKYLFVIAWKYLDDMRENKFALLEEAKSVSVGNDIAVTLSVGIGLHGDSFLQSYEYARIAMDLALGRGGDQVVLKDKQEVEYFGGKSHSTEKATRVKARVKAHALQELIESRDRVIVMGHRLSDIDSLGAALGVCRAAQASGKKGYIVLDTVIGSIRPLLDKLQESGEYNDVFITSARALEMVDDMTIVCVVDVNRPMITECPELLKRAKRVVVIDHHRQTNERIDGALLSYIEPFASSACEMVAEILQYYNDGVKMNYLEADALYAGIMVDTDHFNSKTGVRTFEAAAFLRRCGADSVRVRKLFREELQDYKVKANAVRSAEVFLEAFAISTCAGETKESLNVVAAQAANEMLDINGIQASFVLAAMEGKIYISARSIDEINVQLIMEKMGGGGHMNIAGTQLTEVTMDEAVMQLKETIIAMRANDEI